MGQPLNARAHPSPVPMSNNPSVPVDPCQTISPVHFIDDSHHVDLIPARLTSSPVRLVNTSGHPGLTASRRISPPVQVVDTPRHPAPTRHPIPLPVLSVDPPSRLAGLFTGHTLPLPVPSANTPRYLGIAPNQASPAHDIDVPGLSCFDTTCQMPPPSGFTTGHTIPTPHPVFDRPRLLYPVHHSHPASHPTDHSTPPAHHLGRKTPHASDLPFPAVEPWRDPPPDGSKQPTPPACPAQRSLPTTPGPQSHQEAEVIKLDDDSEDDGSDPSDGENEEDPEDEIELMAVSELSSENGVKVLVCHKTDYGCTDHKTPVLLNGRRRCTAASEDEQPPGSHG